MAEGIDSFPAPPAPFSWLPDVLTLSRLPMAAAVWLVAPWPWALVALMAAAALTDLLDGWAARSLGVMSGRGAWLDPLCDKAFVVSLLGALMLRSAAPWWVFVLIGTREIIQLPLILAYRLIRVLRPRLRFNFRAGLPGKFATVAQFAAVAAVLLQSAVVVLAAVSSVAGCLAVVHYLRRAALLARAEEDAAP
ncbi:hypothetical protein EDM80_00925 [bacterium]|nr:MAG: hypothetical protein EDM80_00925 [bacterium]RIK65302.1 MAG: hypothetical protein DCC64_01295 [Planctomycetota bacterium]